MLFRKYAATKLPILSLHEGWCVQLDKILCFKDH